MPGEPVSWTDVRLAGTRFDDVRWFDRIDSTNRYLLDRAAEGAPEGLVAVADEQTAGRGRLGRTWVAPPGSALLVSALLRPRLAVDRTHLVTLAAGLAALDAVRALTGVQAGLKWPNDVVVDDRKLAGILAEADGVGAVVVGMGCNVRPDVLPADLASIATAVSLDRGELLVAWLRAYDALARRARLGRRGGSRPVGDARSPRARRAGRRDVRRHRDLTHPRGLPRRRRPRRQRRRRRAPPTDR